MLQNCHYMLIFWLLFFVSIHKKILALVLFSANLRKRVFFCFFVCFFFCFYGQESFGFSFNFKSSISEKIFWDLFSFFSFFLSRSSSSVIHLSSKLQYFVEKKKRFMEHPFHVPPPLSSFFVVVSVCRVHFVPVLQSMAKMASKYSSHTRNRVTSPNFHVFSHNATIIPDIV